jgi:hypothetical protein
MPARKRVNIGSVFLADRATKGLREAATFLGSRLVWGLATHLRPLRVCILGHQCTSTYRDATTNRENSRSRCKLHFAKELFFKGFGVISALNFFREPSESPR